jgi:hypothetical protein
MRAPSRAREVKFMRSTDRGREVLLAVLDLSPIPCDRLFAKFGQFDGVKRAASVEQVAEQGGLQLGSLTGAHAT